MMDMEVRGGTTVCFANVLKIFPTVKHFYEFKVAESVIVTGVTLTITVSLYIALERSYYSDGFQEMSKKQTRVVGKQLHEKFSE